MRSGHGETCAPTRTGRSRLMTSTASSRQGGVRRRHATSSAGTSWCAPTAPSCGSSLESGGVRGTSHDRRPPWGWVTVASDDWSVAYDLGQATMSMMLAAADQGIGSGHAAVRDQELARRLLGFPEDRQLAWLIAFGYPADRPLRPIDQPDRRPFGNVVHRARW